MSSISDTSIWIKFFTEAGIPAGDATSYAIIFTDNRIKQTMLMDLNKEYLRDMGISLMGDIIMILKHAKVVSGNLSRQRVLESSSSSTSSSAAGLGGATSTPPPATKKSTPASRTLEHYLRKEERPPPSPPSSANSTLSPSLSARLGGGGGVKRCVEEDDSSPPNKRSSVFNRLGDNSVSSTTNDGPKITVTMHGKDLVRSASGSDSNTKLYSSSSSSSSVFGRLSDRNNSDSDDDRPMSKRPLEYQGILKYSSKETNEKAAIIKKQQSLTSKLGGGSGGIATMKADTTTNIRNRLGAQGCAAKNSSAGIFAREREEFRPKKKPSAEPAGTSDTSFRQFNRETKKLALKKTLDKSPDDSPSFSPPPSPSSSKKYVKKIVKVNKKTGEILSEEKIPLKTNVFSRLGN